MTSRRSLLPRFKFTFSMGSVCSVSVCVCVRGRLCTPEGIGRFHARGSRASAPRASREVTRGGTDVTRTTLSAEILKKFSRREVASGSALR